MKKIISMIKRAGKTVCSAYVSANTIKLSDGRTAFVGSGNGIIYVA